MNKVVIDMSISLDGFIAGPGDRPGLPRGRRAIRRRKLSSLDAEDASHQRFKVLRN